MHDLHSLMKTVCVLLAARVLGFHGVVSLCNVVDVQKIKRLIVQSHMMYLSSWTGEIPGCDNC